MYKVIWDNLAKKELKEALKYIQRDSLQSAEKIKKDIIEKTHSLCQQPLRYAADKFRIDRDVKFRAVEVKKFRISYYINEPSKEVFILRIRNTKQEPLPY